MSSNWRKAQRRLMKKYNIHFDGPAEPKVNEHWPDPRKVIFDHIVELGRTEYDGYKESITYDLNQRPWRSQVLRRAKRVVALAKSCLDSRKNEAGWRSSVEAEIMARLTVEVACKKCRGRLWRSEREACLSGIDEEAARSLSERQMNRTPCTCNHKGSMEDIHDSGISPLFDDRVDEAINYPQELQSELPKRGERPDRVYGLRVTRRLERLLESKDRRPSARGGDVGDVVRSNPFREDGDPIIFPFLLIEAKSEKGAHSFSDIETQTAFAIRELLELQDGLRVASGEAQDWEAGPLVWFLSYKGELWRVSIAYIEIKDKRKHYRVTQLWRGGVDQIDEALRLLLIVDYIFDWARDVYRETITQSLRKLVASDSRSLSYDSDVLSMAGMRRIKYWEFTDNNTIESDPMVPEENFKDALRSFDTQHGVIRDIHYIRSRFLGLYITKENLGLFLNSTNTQDESKKLALDLLNSLVEGWRVKREALDIAESHWTGRDREAEDLAEQNKIFFVVTTATAYVAIDWEQTRELCYLAVAEDAMERLMKHANIRLHKDYRLSDLPFVDTDAFSSNFLALLQTRAEENLLACISRACISTGILSSMGNEHTDAISVTSVEKSDEGVRYRVDAVIKPDAHPDARELVHKVYEQHKIGRNEPSCPFLRTSTVLNGPGLPKPLTPKLGTPGASRWLAKQPKTGQLMDKEILFAVCGNLAICQPSPRLCLFVTGSAAANIKDLRFQDLLQTEPMSYFFVERFDRNQIWTIEQNIQPCIVTMHSPGLLDMVEKFEEAVKALDHRSSRDGGDTNTGYGRGRKKTWTPMKPNAKWDILVTDGLEFMKSTSSSSIKDHVPSETSHNLGRIREVKREDTPTPRPEPTSKGKQPELSILDELFTGGSRGKRPNLVPASNIPRNQDPIQGSSGATPRSVIGAGNNKDRIENVTMVVNDPIYEAPDRRTISIGFILPRSKKFDPIEKIFLGIPSRKRNSPPDTRTPEASLSTPQKRHRADDVEMIDVFDLVSSSGKGTENPADVSGAISARRRDND
ncbi:hypothetical protein F5Y04DRAFT_281154 [Hypomontagnella monticulosa]|nr:hypothetical protein F5Y04DRAFT_281154 [Hypomontagnella monticulosa]